MARRKSLASRLFDHFHEHPRGRLHELLFFAGLGVALGAGTYVAWRVDLVSDPIAWMLAIVAACLVLFALLPQKKRAAAPPAAVAGKRAKIAEQVRASKKEKRKGPDPPIG